MSRIRRVELRGRNTGLLTDQRFTHAARVGGGSDDERAGRGDADGEGAADRNGPRVHVWRARTRTVPLPGVVALLVIAPVLLVLGVVTLGLVAVGATGVLAAPRLLRRGRGAGDQRSGATANDGSTITLDPDDYRNLR